MERPILFSAPMVQAILAGRKTQTRRVAQLVLDGETTGDGRTTGGYEPDPTQGWGRARPGDVLWVRETWGLHRHLDTTDWCRDSIKGRPADDLLSSWKVAYAADAESEGAYWRPSIHMPRWASRITLEVTGVRVERLQQISPRDCEAEGIQVPQPAYDKVCEDPRVLDHEREVELRERFKGLWESIHGAGSWDENPYVWVIEFKRVEVSR